MTKLYARLNLIALFFALFVIMLGAFTRLVDAGLGCPDWPGCYGSMIVPTQVGIETFKAWTEMVHRYAAGLLGLMILGLAFGAIRQYGFWNRKILLPLAIVGMVLFQALLGLWTVTLLLLPLVVTAHLLGGLLILVLLWCLWLRNSHFLTQLKTELLLNRSVFRILIIMATLFTTLQIVLGGWTSTNYAALVCPDFPTCQGQWWPPMDFQRAFDLFAPLGANHLGGLLDNSARVTIQVMHRLSAIFVGFIVGILAVTLLLRARYFALRILAFVMLLVLVIQISLGITGVIKLWPLSVAVAHNGFAAFLLLCVVTLYYALLSNSKK